MSCLWQPRTVPLVVLTQRPSRVARFLGTSGQNIDDIFKYMEEEDSGRLRMAKQTLQWAHVAPTAPDTLWCFPFTERDPFLIDERPDIYFVGNQPAYESTIYSRECCGGPAG